MGKVRTIAVKPLTRPNSEINVTPLVDVVLVLLIIFMVVTPLLEKDIEVHVPPTETAPAPDAVQDQVVVRLSPEGQIDLNGEKLDGDDAYVAALEQKLSTRSDKTIFIVADDRAPYPGLVHVLDGARKAGAVTLGMSTEPPKPSEP